MATTPEKYIQQLEKQIMSFINSKAYGQAISTVLSDYVERIFEEGKNSNNDPIGEYDDSGNNGKGIYINPHHSPVKFQPQGKTGAMSSLKTKKTVTKKSGATFKNGEARKTKWFASYKDFRDSIGRQTSSVNLNLWGHLKNDVSTSLQKQGTKYIIGINRQENVGKAEGAENRYGNVVFKLSEQEKADFIKFINIALINQLNKGSNA